MKPLSQDPIINAVNDGIKKSINIVIENKCYAAAVILIFSGIDTMANIGRPANQEFSLPQDFKTWVDKYFIIQGETKITSDEWWAARNAIIHTWGAYSKNHKQTGVRVIGWMNRSIPNIIYEPRVDSNVVFVAIESMREAFYEGMQRFLINEFLDSSKKQILEERLEELVMTFPAKKKN